MRIRMRQTVTGTFHGIDKGVERGQIVEVGDVDGERYIKNGLAEPVTAGGEENAVLEPGNAETATVKRRGGRPKKQPEWHDDDAQGFKEVEQQ